MIRQLDDFVEAYEAARASGGAIHELRSFAPPSDHPDYCDIVVELIRVDMEQSWDPRRSDRVPAYCEMFPDVLKSPECLERVAFEEYRLRCQSGERIQPLDYQFRYGISTENWPQLADTRGSGSGAMITSTGMEETPEASFSLLTESHPDLARHLAEVEHHFPQVGDHVCGFDLVSVLGEGAFARVFLARQTGLADRLVALKIASAGNPEPQRLAQLQHTNIVPIYSFHQYGPLQVVCMPYLGHVTLEDLSRQLRRSATVPIAGRELVELVSGLSTQRVDVTVGDAAPSRDPREPVDLPSTPERAPQTVPPLYASRMASESYVRSVVWLMARVAEGLAHAHEQGVLHCDLKPANILLTDRGQPLILDFNVAAQSEPGRQLLKAIGGTLQYMSPEQIRALESRERFDERSDIYSLGVIFAELLTGAQPFPVRSGTWRELLVMMIQDRQTVPPLRSKNRHITPGLQAIVHRCLAANPNERYAGAKDLQEDLERYLSYAPLRIARDRSPRERLHKLARRHPRLFSAGGVAVAATMVLALVISGMYARGVQLERLQAANEWMQFQQQQPQVLAGLSVPGMEAELLEHVQQKARKLVERYDVFGSGDWRQHANVSRLPAEDRQQLTRQIAELALWASLAEQTASSDSPDSHSQAWKAVAERALGTSGTSRETFEKTWKAILNARDHQNVELAAEVTSSLLGEHHRASMLLMRGDYAGAVKALQPLTRAQPRNFVAWFWLGNAHAGLRELDQARDCFTVCRTLLPESYLPSFARGLVYLEQQRYPEAADDFQVVIQMVPDLAAARINRAMALHGAGQTAEAIDELTQALSDPNVPSRAYFLRSEYLRLLGRSPEADADWQTGMQQTPRDELSFVKRGVARMGQAPEEALEDFDAALQLNPASRAALWNAAHVCSERLGRTREAFRYMQQLITLQPNDALAHASYAVLLAREGEVEKAQQEISRALENVHGLPRPQDRGLVWYQGACVTSLLQQKSSAEVAASQLAKAFLLDPGLTQFFPQDPDVKAVREDPRVRQQWAAARTLLQMSGQ